MRRIKSRLRTITSTGPSATCAGAWVVLLVVAGCGILGTTRSALPTGGVALEMLIESGDSSVALYRVEPSGTIGFGGGFDARLNKTTWTGRMRAGEIDELLALLETDGWFEADPAAISSPPDRTYRITLSGPKGRRRFEVGPGQRGAGPDVAPLAELLERISRRRLDDFLDALPKPGDPG